MARIVYTGKPIQASTINDYYNRLDAIRTWNGRYSAISNRGSVGSGVRITSAQIMNEIFKNVVDTDIEIVLGKLEKKKILFHL